MAPLQAERAVRGQHEHYRCSDAHENAHASDLHDMELTGTEAVGPDQEEFPHWGIGSADQLAASAHVCKPTHHPSAPHLTEVEDIVSVAKCSNLQEPQEPSSHDFFCLLPRRPLYGSCRVVTGVRAYHNNLWALRASNVELRLCKYCVLRRFQERRKYRLQQLSHKKGNAKSWCLRLLAHCLHHKLATLNLEATACVASI